MAAETAGLERARLRVLAAASTAPTASGNGRHSEAPHSRAAAPNEVRWNWHAVGCTVGIYLQIRAISRSQESGPASCLVRREKARRRMPLMAAASCSHPRTGLGE
jgi:hypothetical protein